MFWKLRGGVHPRNNKEMTAEKPCERMPLPERLFVPVRQHIGEPAIPKIKAGDIVYKGDVLAGHENGKTPPVHCPTSGRVVDISNYPHPLFGISLAVVIEADGKDEWRPGLVSSRSYLNLSPDEMIAIIYQNGIVGMGGAAFPTHMKLSPPKDKIIDTLIVNGAECEPFLTADYRVMIEHADEVVRGTQIAMKILGVNNAFIGIEDDKPKAVEHILAACAGTSIKVALLKTRYPQGAEKMLIKAITGREVPSGRLPMDAGCVVQNVGTLKAIADAVEKNIPLIERVVTVSGSSVREPRNLIVKTGTTFNDVFAFCGGFTEKAAEIIMGGPMMGLAQVSADAVVIKSTSGLLALPRRKIDNSMERPCIRCGRCLDACTMRLRPNILSILSETGKHMTAQTEYDLMDCVECGCCSYVCPSKRNIVHYIKQSKAKNAFAKSLK